jgi:hypothetical protein
VVAWAVGVDIGGTNVRGAEVSSAGEPGCVLAERLDDFLFTPPGGVCVRLSRLRGLSGCVGAALLAHQPGAWS